MREIAPGRTLGGILDDVGVRPGEHLRAVRAFSERHDPRRLRPGGWVRARLHPDEDVVEGIEIGVDRDRTVRLRRDPLGHWTSSIEVVTTTRDTVFAAGAIRSDLWTAVMTDPVLAAMPRADRVSFIDRLDRVFQWQVDFHRIHPGGTYRFVFARDRRPDGSMRSGQLVAAELVNRGRAYHAIWFDPNDDGDGTWYDLEGESVRRAFLMRPLAFSRISSRFTNSRFHPILKTWRAHRGVDYAADAGTPVEATADGTVARAAWSDSYGRYVDIRHANGFLTRYAHLQGFAGGISPGAFVRQGRTIGYVGMTGMATGPHLHYEMHRHGQRVDPLAIELPADDPVPADDFERWTTESRERFALLMTLPGPEEVLSRRAEQ